MLGYLEYSQKINSVKNSGKIGTSGVSHGVRYTVESDGIKIHYGDFIKAASMQKYVEDRHQTADRSMYDTPASVLYCACDSCNAARKANGKAIKSWGKARIYENGTVDGLYREQIITEIEDSVLE